MSPLTNIETDIKPNKLTTKINAPFIVSFKYSLKKGYKLKDLQLCDVQELSRFFDKVAQMDFNQVEQKYRKTSDKKDQYKCQQVIHYQYSNSGRIHGIIEEGRFKVLRIDPNHKFHNK